MTIVLAIIAAAGGIIFWRRKTIGRNHDVETADQTI